MSAASKTKNYDVIPTDVRRMTKLHTAAGDIKFTSLMKLIYSYIWTFQGNKQRGNDDPIHTNTNVIAWEMGVSEKALIAALMALDAAKVVIKQTVQVCGSVNSNNYVATPPASVVALGVTPLKPGNGKVSNPANKKSEKIKGNGHKEAVEAETPQAEQADTPTDQNPEVAPEPVPVVTRQRDRVAPDNDNGSDDRTTGNHGESQDEQDNDPLLLPNKPELEDIPWQGMAFEGSGRLTEAAYKWALTVGATDWRHACCLVWEKVGVPPPNEIEEHRKPKFLM